MSITTRIKIQLCSSYGNILQAFIVIKFKVLRRMLVKSWFLDKAWICYEFPKDVVTKPPWAPLGGGHDHHKITLQNFLGNEDFNTSHNKQFWKKLEVMDSFCTWQQWESGAHRLAYLAWWRFIKEDTILSCSSNLSSSSQNQYSIARTCCCSESFSFSSHYLAVVRLAINSAILL
jgi:hypothetical protein